MARGMGKGAGWMLTPRELRQIEFRKVFRGYDPDEVDEFLARLIEEYERLRERPAEPARDRAAAPADGAKAGDGEPAAEVREAAALARQAADELRANAQWEARLILDEARQRAARIEEEARQRVSREQTRLRELREEVDRLLRQLRRLTEAYLEEPGPGEGLRRPDPGSEASGGRAPERVAPAEDEDETRSFPVAAAAQEPLDDEPDDESRAFLRYSRG